MAEILPIPPTDSTIVQPPAPFWRVTVLLCLVIMTGVALSFIVFFYSYNQVNTAVARQNRQAAARPAPPTAAPAPALATDTAEHHLLMLALNHEQLGPALARAIPHHWIDTGHIAGNLLNRVLAEFEQNSWPGREHLDSLLETAEERTLVATLIFNALELDDPGKVAAAGLQQLRARALEPRLRQIELALANPQPDSDFDPISLLKERSELQRQLRQPITLNLAG